LAGVDLGKAVVDGSWQRTADGIAMGKGWGTSHLITSPIAPGGYDVEMTFVRTDGDDIIGLVLPVGANHTMLMFTAPRRAYYALSGLEAIDGKGAKANGTGFLADLVTGKLHTVRASVRRAPEGWLIMASLDGRPVVYWRGAESAVGMGSGWSVDKPETFALAGFDVAVTFKSLRVRAADFLPYGPTPADEK
jgi:hypothetical protein